MERSSTGGVWPGRKKGWKETGNPLGAETGIATATATATGSGVDGSLVSVDGAFSSNFSSMALASFRGSLGETVLFALGIGLIGAVPP